METKTKIVGFDLEWPSRLSDEDWEKLEAHRKAGDIDETCPTEDAWRYNAKTEAGREFIASIEHYDNVSVERWY